MVLVPGGKESKGQSAIEYLVTYGWVLLVLMGVMGTLYYLGVFSSATFSVRAQTGACSISRPNGPYTTYLLSLKGVCNNLPPQYMPEFTGEPTEYVQVDKDLFTGGPFTILAWTYIPSGTVLLNNCQSQGTEVGWLWTGTSATPANGIGFFFTDTGVCVEQWQSSTMFSIQPCSTSFSTGKWYYTGFSWNPTVSNVIFWVNGTEPCGPVYFSQVSSNNALNIGGSAGTFEGTSGVSYGYISDVQLYNVTLGQDDVEALYKEGVGGQPIELTNLVGWWPLNGNSNDYSGNLNSGIVGSGINFVEGWQTGTNYNNP